MNAAADPLVSFGPLHPHLLFEVAAYSTAFALYRHLRRRRGDVLDDDTRWTIVVAAAVGAALGSKLLAWLHHYPEAAFLASGKTLVGALLGGWLAVELAKRSSGIERRTGDLFVLPLCLGTAIGRVGCLLSGLGDRTYGSPTDLPWGLDLGDGIARHPTQLYEIVLVALVAVAVVRAGPARREGTHFRAYLLAYFAFRLAVDFLKPGRVHAGLTVLQWAALAGILAVLVGASGVNQELAPHAPRPRDRGKAR